VIYEAAIPFRVGPVRVTLADPSAPLPPVRRPAPPPEPVPEPVAVVPVEQERRAEQAAREERERLDGVLGQLLDVARDLRSAQRGRLEEMQRVAVELAVAVASNLLYERIESGDYPIEELVRDAVRRLEPRQAVTVRLHPEDLALLETVRALWPEDFAWRGSGGRFFVDRLAGTSRLREAIDSGVAITGLEREWEPGLRAFAQLAEKVWLYPP